MSSCIANMWDIVLMQIDNWGKSKYPTSPTYALVLSTKCGVDSTSFHT